MSYVKLEVSIHNEDAIPSVIASEVRSVLMDHFDPELSSDIEVEVDEYSTEGL